MKNSSSNSADGRDNITSDDVLTYFQSGNVTEGEARPFKNIDWQKPKFVGPLTDDGKKPIHRMPLAFPGRLPGDARPKDFIPKSISWIVLDFDGLDDAQQAVMLEGLQGLDCGWVLHSTYSHHREGKGLCYRAWIRTDRPMTIEMHDRTKRLLVNAHFQGLVDETCFEAKRCYFLPAAEAAESPYEFHEEPGAPLPVSYVDLDAPDVSGKQCPRGREPKVHGAWLAQNAPPAIEGQGGHSTLLSVMRALRWGLELDEETTTAILAKHWSPWCKPPFQIEGKDASNWAHKLREAGETFGDLPRGYLLPVMTPADAIEQAKETFVGSAPIDLESELFKKLARLEASGAPEIPVLWDELCDAGYKKWTALRDAVKRAGKQLKERTKGDGKPSVPVDHPEGKDLMLPAGYHVEKGILRCGDEAVMHGQFVLLAKCPSSEGTFARVAFKSPSSPWKSSLVPYRSLVDTRGVLCLADHGCNVSSLESASIVAFVRDFVATNEALLDRPIATRTGWHSSGAFAWGRTVIGGPEDLSAEYPVNDAIQEQFVGSLRAQGDASQSFAAIGDAVTTLPVVAVCVAAAIAACYALPANRPTIGIHLAGTGGKGKTRTLKIVGSVWGSTGGAAAHAASGVIAGSNTTARAVEIAAAARNHLPFLISDLRPVPGLPDLLHSIVNGEARARATTTGGSTFGGNFDCGAVITEGETSVLGLTNRQGTHRRFLELDPGMTKEEIEELWELAEICSEHYGHLGPACVRLGAPDRALYSFWQHNLECYSKEVVGHVATLMATVEHVAPLLGVDPHHWQTQIATALMAEERSRVELGVSQAERAGVDLGDILVELGSQIAASQEATRSEHYSPREGWAGYRAEGEIVIRSSVLNSALRDRGHHTKDVIAGLVDQGQILPGAEEGTHTVQRTIAGIPGRRCYRIHSPTEALPSYPGQ